MRLEINQRILMLHNWLSIGDGYKVTGLMCALMAE